MTTHNQLFGWVHGFRFNQNNVASNAANITPPPYRPIIADPSLDQIVNNWNLADTGMVFSTVFFSAVYAFRKIRHFQDKSLLNRRVQFSRVITLSWVFGVILALRNSCYRLEGFVPNGLKSYPIEEPVKYDLTSQFLKQSFWRLIFESPRKE